MSTNKTTLPDTTGATFEKVWAMFLETDKKIKELAEQSAEQTQKVKNFIKHIDKQIGDLGNRFGEMSEHLVAPGIAKRFNELGYHFEEVSPGGIEIQEVGGQVLAEIDLLLENTKTIAVVEVKSSPRREHIEQHIKRIEIFRQFREKRGKERKVIIGVIAGAVFRKEVKKMAIEAGFFVVTQSGDTVKIEVPTGFTPREF